MLRVVQHALIANKIAIIVLIVPTVKNVLAAKNVQLVKSVQELAIVVMVVHHMVAAIVMGLALAAMIAKDVMKVLRALAIVLHAFFVNIVPIIVLGALSVKIVLVVKMATKYSNYLYQSDI